MDLIGSLGVAAHSEYVAWYLQSDVGLASLCTVIGQKKKKKAPTHQAIRHKTKTGRDFFTFVFPRLTQFAFCFFEFSLALVKFPFMLIDIDICSYFSQGTAH